MRDGDDLVATVSRAAMRDAIDVAVEAADGCMWVVIHLDVGDVKLKASIGPADSEVLYRDLRGGVTPEGIERARLEAAAR